jgi:hypothetical protein
MRLVTWVDALCVIGIVVILIVVTTWINDVLVLRGLFAP